MKTKIRRMGNSQGVLIPKAVIAQLGFEARLEMEIAEETRLLRRPKQVVRQGWAEASLEIAKAGDDALAMGEFANEGDTELAW